MINKACGGDLIINEFLKYSVNKLLPIFVSLFNIVFDTICLQKKINAINIIKVD
jgi:hypothetical protein